MLGSVCKSLFGGGFPRLRPRHCSSTVARSRRSSKSWLHRLLLFSVHLMPHNPKRLRTTVLLQWFHGGSGAHGSYAKHSLSRGAQLLPIGWYCYRSTDQGLPAPHIYTSGQLQVGARGGRKRWIRRLHGYFLSIQNYICSVDLWSWETYKVADFRHK